MPRRRDKFLLAAPVLLLLLGISGAAAEDGQVNTIMDISRHLNTCWRPPPIRAYQVYLTNEKKLAPASVLIAVAALRFLYKVSLKREWPFDEVIPAPKKPQKLPVVLSPEEVLEFLGCVGNAKHRTILTACYAAGLRISEAVALTPPAIESKRMVIFVPVHPRERVRPDYIPQAAGF